MKKYVLNIERLYTGETANALVLRQVDEELPVLLPSMPEESGGDITAWIERCRGIHSEFNPPESVTTPQQLNECIMDFNLELQERFKANGHEELYMMDDTQWMNPNPDDRTFSSDKVGMHALNGHTDEGINSSQMNVLFPFRKLSSKSLHAEQLSVESPYELDGRMESSRQMSLQGKVSSVQCVQGTATVGGNMYVMSPLVDSDGGEGLLANGMTIVNSCMDAPYHFPHTMTLFQPSRDRYMDPNMDRSNHSDGVTPFINWYDTHNRRTVVTPKKDYGGNSSDLLCLCNGSYVLDLATHSPTDLVLEGDSRTVIPLDADTFREARGSPTKDRWYAMRTGSDGDENAMYVFRNSVADTLSSDGMETMSFADVGFKFNLYSGFISGEERILHVTIPQDSDFNTLHLKFTCRVEHDDQNLLGEYVYTVHVGDDEAYRLECSGGDASHIATRVEYVYGERQDEVTCVRNFDIPINGTVLGDHALDLRVKVEYAVDYARRNSETDYQGFLKSSGVVLVGLSVDGEGTGGRRQLTFADYVNERGISEAEWKSRLRQFWNVSRYMRDVPYQLVLETSMGNTVSSGVAYPNNYSTGDMYGDVFTTKSTLDASYGMDIELKGGGQGDHSILRAKGRRYLNLGQCSQQLFLTFVPTEVDMEYDPNGESSPTARMATERDDGGNYRYVEVVKSMNRFQSSIMHKSNVFSLVVQNSNLAEDTTSGRDEELERYKGSLRDSVVQFVRNACEGIVPAHTQLFDVQFT